MSETITLYSCTASKETVDKSASWAKIADLTCELLQDVDILHPVILVKPDSSTATIAKITKECNYIYISTFERYYYVTGIVAKTGTLLEISCEVDPLMSWKTAILAQNVIVARNEKEFSLYLDDGILKLYNNPNVTTYEFPSGFTAQEYILAVAGG